MPKGNECCPHASFLLLPSGHPYSPRSQQLLPHTTALEAAASRILLKHALLDEEEDAEATAELGDLFWHWQCPFDTRISSNLSHLREKTSEPEQQSRRRRGRDFFLSKVSEMNPTSQSLSTTEYEYGYDENTAPCKEGNTFRRFKSLFLPILYCLVFVFCLLGNSLVLWVLLTRKRLTTMTDICLLNLAASDLIFVVPLPFQAHYASDQWVFGNAMCKIMAGIYYTGFYSGIFFITLMSIDRYIAIVHAVYAMRIRTASCGIIISLILWLVAGLASVPNILFNQELEIEQAVQCVPTYPPGDNTWKVASQFAANILGLLIPFSILVCCYTQILKNLQKCKNRNKIKAIKMIFIIVIVFFLFWTPFNIALLLDSLQSLHLINDCTASSHIALALQLTETISFIHCCLNPVIYAFAGVTFKAHLKGLLQSCARVLPSPAGAAGAAQSLSTPTQVLGWSDSAGAM